MVLIMGMRLSGCNLLLTEEQYKQLKNKELYIKNCYTLELISEIDAEVIIKTHKYEALEMIYQTAPENFNEEIDNFKKSFDEWVDNIAYDYIEYDKLPLTLNEFLEYDYNGEWVTNELQEQEIYDRKAYLLSQIRYW